MPNDQTLSIIIKLQDDASAGLAAISEKIKTAGAGVSTALSSVGATVSTFGKNMISAGESMQYAGQKMSIGLTVPLVALGVTSAKAASDFEGAMLKIQTGAGASAQEVAAMSKQFIQMAESGAQQTPLQLAQGMYYVESAGFRAADAVNVLKAAMDGANVSGVDLNTVAQQLVTVMNATHTPTAQAEDVMALLNATVGQGVMTMNDLIGAMSTGIIPKANSVGIGINDVAAALDTMTRSGVPAQDAATRLGMTLSLIEAPSTKATKALASIGLSSTALADEMRTKGLIPALQDLEEHLTHAGLTATEQAQLISHVFGGGRTSGAALLLLQNLDQMQTAFNGLAGGAAQFSGYIKTQGETTEAYYNRMKAAASAASIQIGNAMMPLEAEIFPKLAKAIEAVADWFSKLSPTMQNIIIGGLALLATLGPVLIILGSLFTAIGTIATAIGGLFTILGGAGAVFGAFTLAAAPWLIVLAALATAIVLVTNSFNSMQDAATGAMNSASQLDSMQKKLDPLIQKATGSKKTELQALQTSSQQAAANAAATGERYTGGMGVVNAIIDQFTPKAPSVTAPASARAPASSGSQGAPVYNFHFNGTVAGDAGIKDIITKTMGTLNRQTTLRMAGT